MKELRKIPTEKLGCRKCETFGRIYAVTATETDGTWKKKKSKQTGCRTVSLRFC